MSEIDISRILNELRTNTALAQGKLPAAGDVPDFATMLNQSIEKVNQLQQTSVEMTTAFEMGDPQANLVETMIAVQKAGVAFQSMIQVRNKLLTAYQEIMSMPL